MKQNYEYASILNVISDWKEGSPIVWKVEWQGKKYEDKGVILKLEPERLIQYSHFSPLSGKPELIEDYHTATFELSGDRAQAHISLSLEQQSD